MHTFFYSFLWFNNVWFNFTISISNYVYLNWIEKQSWSRLKFFFRRQKRQNRLFCSSRTSLNEDFCAGEETRQSIWSFDNSKWKWKHIEKRRIWKIGEDFRLRKKNLFGEKTMMWKLNFWGDERWESEIIIVIIMIVMLWVMVWRTIEWVNESKTSLGGEFIMNVKWKSHEFIDLIFPLWIVRDTKRRLTSSKNSSPTPSTPHYDLPKLQMKTGENSFSLSHEYVTWNSKERFFPYLNLNLRMEIEKPLKVARKSRKLAQLFSTFV